VNTQRPDGGSSLFSTIRQHQGDRSFTTVSSNLCPQRIGGSRPEILPP
jgi:hypothetical protein